MADASWWQTAATAVAGGLVGGGIGALSTALSDRRRLRAENARRWDNELRESYVEYETKLERYWDDLQNLDYWDDQTSSPGDDDLEGSDEWSVNDTHIRRHELVGQVHSTLESVERTLKRLDLISSRSLGQQTRVLRTALHQLESFMANQDRTEAQRKVAFQTAMDSSRAFRRAVRKELRILD